MLRKREILFLILHIKIKYLSFKYNLNFSTNPKSKLNTSPTPLENK